MPDTIREKPTVTRGGERLEQLPDGVTFRDAVTNVDERGTVCEMFDPRWGWTDTGLVFAYFTTVRPGVVKGWGMHLEHEDRYFILYGDLEVVLYDDRPDSPTREMVAKVYLSEHERRLMNIPPGIWHADRNVGSGDATLINFPTKPYDHQNPDKYRLPLDTDQIPYSFPEGTLGW